jgi:phage gp36-like protein
MPKYATYIDIEREIKGLKLTESGVLNQEAVSDIIDQEEATIDTFVSSAYTMPITDEGALLFLKKICVALVSHRVGIILKIKDAPDDSADQSTTRAGAQRQAMRMLDKISKREMNLGGATRISGRELFYTNPDSDVTEPVFKKSEQQW